jgi:hypothetical protein
MNFLLKDITTVTRGIIAHGCNASGGFGSGVAGAIKRKWPMVAQAHKDMGEGEDLMGLCHLINLSSSAADELWVANCYTQLLYRRPGDPSDKRYADCNAIEKCLTDVMTHASVYDLPVYIPPIGCDRGGLDFFQDLIPILIKIDAAFPNIELNVCDITSPPHWYVDYE